MSDTIAAWLPFETQISKSSEKFIDVIFVVVGKRRFQSHTNWRGEKKRRIICIGIWEAVKLREHFSHNLLVYNNNRWNENCGSNDLEWHSYSTEKQMTSLSMTTGEFIKWMRLIEIRLSAFTCFMELWTLKIEVFFCSLKIEKLGFFFPESQLLLRSSIEMCLLSSLSFVVM